MNTVKLMTHVMMVAVAAVWLSGSAWAAACGQVSASATAKNQNMAIAKANAIGLKITRRLDRRHGSAIHYQAARVDCREAKRGVSCKITQRYCIEDGSGQDIPGNFGDPNTVDPNTPRCKKFLAQCNKGKVSACTDYESNCQND